MHTAVLHFITSNMSLFVQDLFINNRMISTELTKGDVKWIFVCYNKSRVMKNDVRDNAEDCLYFKFSIDHSAFKVQYIT
jgi:hypothetical protein